MKLLLKPLRVANLIVSHCFRNSIPENSLEVFDFVSQLEAKVEEKFELELNDLDEPPHLGLIEGSHAELLLALLNFEEDLVHAAAHLVALVVHEDEDLEVVLSTLEELDVLALHLHERLVDLTEVESEHLLPDHPLEGGVLFHDTPPVRFPNRVALHLGVG